MWIYNNSYEILFINPFIDLSARNAKAAWGGGNAAQQRTHTTSSDDLQVTMGIDTLRAVLFSKHWYTTLNANYDRMLY
jgi:hypothetical protein